MLLLSRFTPVDGGLDNVSYLIDTLHQDTTESLEDYYRRADDLLHASGGKDKNDSVELSSQERFMLGRVARQFLNGLYNSCLKPYSLLPGCSLLQTYRITREQERLMLEIGEKAFCCRTRYS